MLVMLEYFSLIYWSNFLYFLSPLLMGTFFNFVIHPYDWRIRFEKTFPFEKVYFYFFVLHFYLYVDNFLIKVIISIYKESANEQRAKRIGASYWIRQ